MPREREPLDLTPEEREDCIKDYIDEFIHSNGSIVAELTCRRKLTRVGLDRYEINDLFKTAYQKRREV